MYEECKRLSKLTWAACYSHRGTNVICMAANLAYPKSKSRAHAYGT